MLDLPIKCYYLETNSVAFTDMKRTCIMQGMFGGLQDQMSRESSDLTARGFIS